MWDDRREAEYVADEVEALQLKRIPLNETAVLVRAGFQTRAFEECFVSHGIPYRVVGGLRFYERVEIRDAIAYMRLAKRSTDNLAFERIINTPKRGIGKQTLETIREASREQGISMVDAARGLVSAGIIKGKTGQALATLLNQLVKWHGEIETLEHATLVSNILRESGYMGMWEADKSIEADGRVENLKELVTALEEFENLDAFLEHVALVTDADAAAEEDMVSIMTMHGAKGLEFEAVFCAGWEEGLFPSQKSMEEKGKKGLEEERRLAYVAITRSKRLAWVIFAANRKVFGQWQSNTPSRFVDDMPPEHVEVINNQMGPGYVSPNQQDFERQKVAHSRRPKQRGTTHTKLQGKSSDPLGMGARVFHIKFGYGVVEKTQGDQLTVQFDKAGTKTIMKDYVKPADAV